MSRKSISYLRAIFISLIMLPGISNARVGLDSLLRKTCARYDLPAMGIALITDGRLQQVAVTGVRKYGDTTEATTNDLWHLGSCTKAFTSLLIARLVEEKKLNWNTTIGEVFPEMKMHKSFKGVTIEMLLSHYGGLPELSWPKGMSFESVWALPGSPREQRYEYAKRMLSARPASKPGIKMIYSNAGISIAGAMAEKIMNASFEDLLKHYVMEPLEISSEGYGAMNTPGMLDEPWQHFLKNGKHIAIDAGIGSDNPPAITPAGRLHLTLGDWSKFALAQLSENENLLKPETWHKLHSLPFGGEYGFGFFIVPRPWAGGITYSHDGSNNQNYSSIWLAPKKKFGIMVVTNEGGENADKACQEILVAVITDLFKS